MKTNPILPCQISEDQTSSVPTSTAGNYHKAVGQHFQSTAAYWKDVYQEQGLEGAIYRHRRERVLQFVDQLELSPGSRVLEIGCGGGWVTVALAQRGFQVDAIDIAQNMIEATRALAEAAGLKNKVTASLGDIHSLPFADQKFDLILAVAVLPWVADNHPAVREMARVLERGGHLIVSVVNRWQLHHCLDPVLNPLLASLRPAAGDMLRLLGLLKARKTPRIQTCSIWQFDRVLKSAHLRRVAGCTSGFLPFSLLGRRLFSDATSLRLHLKLQSMSDRGFPLLRSAGSNYIAVARK